MEKMAVKNGIPELSGKEFEKFISESDASVVDFFADWCMPCLIMAPVFEELSEKYKGKIKFGKVNVDDNQSLSSKFKVLSIPTTIFFKKGKEAGRVIGAMHQDEFEKRLNAAVK